MAVDTRKVSRRTLRFESLDALERELDQLELAHRAGTLQATGNWSPGQAFNHLASWIERYEKRDLPSVPWYMKPVGRLMKARLIGKGFPPGLPGPTGEAQIEPECSFEQGIERLRSKMQMLKGMPMGQPNPFFGRLTDDQVVRLHLRHAELHLGFLCMK